MTSEDDSAIGMASKTGGVNRRSATAVAGGVPSGKGKQPQQKQQQAKQQQQQQQQQQVQSQQNHQTQQQRHSSVPKRAPAPVEFRRTGSGESSKWDPQRNLNNNSSGSIDRNPARFTDAKAGPGSGSIEKAELPGNSVPGGEGTKDRRRSMEVEGREWRGGGGVGSPGGSGTLKGEESRLINRGSQGEEGGRFCCVERNWVAGRGSKEVRIELLCFFSALRAASESRWAGLRKGCGPQLVCV